MTLYTVICHSCEQNKRYVGSTSIESVVKQIVEFHKARNYGHEIEVFESRGLTC